MNRIKYCDVCGISIDFDEYDYQVLKGTNMIRCDCCGALNYISVPIRDIYEDQDDGIEDYLR